MWYSDKIMNFIFLVFLQIIGLDCLDWLDWRIDWLDWLDWLSLSLLQLKENRALSLIKVWLEGWIRENFLSPLSFLKISLFHFFQFLFKFEHNLSQRITNHLWLFGDWPITLFNALQTLQRILMRKLGNWNNWKLLKLLYNCRNELAS